MFKSYRYLFYLCESNKSYKFYLVCILNLNKFMPHEIVMYVKHCQSTGKQWDKIRNKSSIYPVLG